MKYNTTVMILKAAIATSTENYQKAWVCAENTQLEDEYLKCDTCINLKTFRVTLQMAHKYWSIAHIFKICTKIFMERISIEYQASD